MSLKDAIEADRKREIETAAALYEQELLGSAPSAEAAINLLVLYWESSSMGFYAAHHLSDGFVALAQARYRELLDSLLASFPREPSVRFWTSYIRDFEECRELNFDEIELVRAEHPDYLEPEFVRIVSETEIGKSIVATCKTVGTVRAEYVSSFLEGVFARARGAGWR